MLKYLQKYLPKKYNYWHGLAWLILMNSLTFSWVFIDPAYYNSLNKISIAPPAWFFGIAWGVNNVLVIIGNIWTLNHKPSSDRTKLLILQGLSWFNYVVFSYLSFGTKIPAMFFIPTFSMLILTIMSIYYARKVDLKISYTFATLITWLFVASVLGLSVWIYN
jgi:tryptophan-rich sensory protein